MIGGRSRPWPAPAVFLGAWGFGEGDVAAHAPPLRAVVGILGDQSGSKESGRGRGLMHGRNRGAFSLIGDTSRLRDRSRFGSWYTHRTSRAKPR